MSNRKPIFLSERADNSDEFVALMRELKIPIGA